MNATLTYLLVLTALLAPVANAQDIPLERCKHLQQRIDYYTKLRRNGGSASQMESWKKARSRHEQEFRDGDCYRYPTSSR